MKFGPVANRGLNLRTRASTSFNREELRLLSVVVRKAAGHPDFSVLLSRVEGRIVMGKVRRMLAKVEDGAAEPSAGVLPSAGNPWGFDPGVRVA